VEAAEVANVEEEIGSFVDDEDSDLTFDDFVLAAEEDTCLSNKHSTGVGQQEKIRSSPLSTEKIERGRPSPGHGIKKSRFLRFGI